MYHLTINGRQMCRHTDCAAGRKDQMHVQARNNDLSIQCEYPDQNTAWLVATIWSEVHPHQRVGVVIGQCPENT